MITEDQLNGILQNDSTIVALGLVGRPALPGDDLTLEIDGEEQRVNLADVYLFRRPFQADTVSTELLADQLALPVGAISEESRISAKPVLSTPRTNTVTEGGGGGGQVA